MTTKLCADHDEDCPSIYADGGCLTCWLYDPGRGFCPYLRTVNEPECSVSSAEAEPPR